MRALTHAQRPLPRAPLRLRCGTAQRASRLAPSHRPLRWRVAAADDGAAPAPADEDDLAARSQRLTASLATYGVPASRARLLVAGPGSDTQAVRLYGAALDGASPPAGSGDALRLARGLEALQVALDAKVDEAEAFAEAAERRKQSVASGAELTEAEKLALGRGITSGLMVGVQGSIWSSFLLLVGAFILLALTAGSNGGGTPSPAARRRVRLPPSAALSPEAARSAVDAALRGDAESLAAATGHYVNAAATAGLPDVALFLLAVGAPPLALAMRFGARALGAVALTSGLMVLPTLSLLTRPPPSDRAEVAPVPLLCLMAAEAVALLRCFVFNG